jgi:hypothetical protein
MKLQLTKQRRAWLQNLAIGDTVVVVSGIRQDAEICTITGIHPMLNLLWVKTAEKTIPFRREDGTATYGHKHLQHRGAIRRRKDGTRTVV